MHLSAARPDVLLIAAPGAACDAAAGLLVALGARQADQHAHALDLDTRYYTATLSLQLQPLLAKGEAQADLGPPAAAQAILLLCSAACHDSWAAVRDWAQGAPGVGDADIRLLVACHGTERGSQPTQQPTDSAAPCSARDSAAAWHSKAREWACEGCWEWVEAAPGDPRLDASLADADGEPMGVARVRAALEAHMWPGLTHKPRAQRGGTGLRGTQRQQQQAGIVTTSSSSSALQQGAGDARSQPQAPAAPAAASAAAARQQPLGGGLLGEDEAELEDTEAAGDLGKLMQQVAGMRASLAGLPDAQRRAAAADLAYKLAALMGLDDSDDASDPGEPPLEAAVAAADVQPQADAGRR